MAVLRKRWLAAALSDRRVLRDTIARTLQVAEQSGVRALFVHAIDEEARDWYVRYGFEPSPTHDLELMVLLDDIRISLGLS